MQNVKATTPGTVSDLAGDRIQISNTGDFSGSDVDLWQADAHRFRRVADWAGKGNDASFVVESDVTAEPGAGPVHGGAWSVLSLSGGTTPGFAFLGSGYRRHAGAMYGIHGEVFDFGPVPGACIVFNAESAQGPLCTQAGSTYIGYNNQVGPTALGAVGLQIQSVAGARPGNYSAGVRFDRTKADVGVDMSTADMPVALALPPGARIKFASGVSAGRQTWYSGSYTPRIVGALEILVDGVTLYLPVSSNHP